MDQAQSLRQWAKRREHSSALRVYAVTSGKGGVGKTNTVANIAVCASKANQRVLIIDADLGLANVELLFGLRPKSHLGQLLRGDAILKDVIIRAPHGIDLLPAGSGEHDLSRLDEAQQILLTRELDALEDVYDLILIDSSAGIGENVLFFTSAAQQVLLVVTPEPTSLTDAYAMVKILSTQGRVTDFDVLVNCARNEAHALEVFARLSGVSAKFLSARLHFAGHIPPDDHVRRAVMAQKPVCEIYPNCPASVGFQAVTTQLLRTPPRQALGGLKFLWERLLKNASTQVVG